MEVENEEDISEVFSGAEEGSEVQHDAKDVDKEPPSTLVVTMADAT